MANYTPKKSNFLRQLFTKNEKIYNSSHDEQPFSDDKLLLDYYSSLAMYHPDLIVVFSPEGEILSENKNSINEFLGYSPRKKMDFKKLIPVESYALLDSSFKNTLKGKSERHEIEVKNRYGHMVYVSLTFIPIKRAKSEVEGVYLIIEDITAYKNLTKEVELNEKHLNHAQQISKIGSWEYVIEEDKLYCSDYFYDIFGFDRTDDVPMNKPFQFVHNEDYKEAYDKVFQAISKGTSFVSEYRIYHGKTKVLKYIKTQAEAIWKDNKPHRLVGVIKDVTTQKQLENEIETTNNNLNHIFDNLNVGIWMRESIDGDIVHASRGIEELLHIPLETLYDNPDSWKDMILPEHRSEVLHEFKRLQKGESIEVKYRITTGDGTTKWVLEQTVPRVNNKGEIINVFGMVTDITPEVEMQEQLTFFATHDTLTGLPNQRSLYEKLDAICNNEAEPFAILYLDLDRFNIINDSLGYHVGDSVLKEVASRIISTVTEGAYIARLSGNDFVVIIEDPPNKESIFTLAEEIITNMGVELTVNEYELHITTSIGIGFFPQDGSNKLTLLENAHSALYHAKKRGKNNYQIYSFSKDISSYKKYAIEKDMRKAIVNEEFELYYQPQVNPVSGVMEGAEALIRWNHEEWGLVSPGEFIPLAEENHLIHHISDWVIRKVCGQLRDWKDNGYTLRPIAINISPIRFLKKGLVKLVKEQLELHQIPAKYVEIEITEGSLLRSEESVLSTVAALKELGVKIAIDDFGTGYASLNYLREFQADTIKVDQVFIQSNDGQNDVDRAIVSSILHLAKEINVKIVAEGVEEYEQFEFLKQKECDLIQGYLYSKPVPIKDFEQMMQIGYLKPLKRKSHTVPEKERRNFYRFEFPYSVLGEMTILEINKRKVDLGLATILIENISLGGLKMISSLNLPVNSKMKFKLHFKLMNEPFKTEGTLAWKNEGKGSTFYYGIEFDIGKVDEDRLVGIINKMTALRNRNQEIPDTDFIHEDSYLYIHKNL